MARTQALPTRNILIQMGPTGALVTAYTSANYTTIGEVMDFTGPSATRDWPQATHFSSDSGRHEFIPGMTDEGTLEFEINYNPRVQTAVAPGSATVVPLLASLDEVETRNFALVFSDNYRATTETKNVVIVNAGLQNFAPSGRISDRISGRATLKLTGPVTRTTG
jgi:hypothetical protein